MILDAFIKVKENNLKLKLVIVGLGPQLDEYKDFVEDNQLESFITFVGKKPFEEVPYYYQAGDAFISASTSETQGLTYIEGLAANKAIGAASGAESMSSLKKIEMDDDLIKTARALGISLGD